jgi:hypothetical protein
VVNLAQGSWRFFYFYFSLRKTYDFSHTCEGERRVVGWTWEEGISAHVRVFYSLHVRGKTVRKRAAHVVQIGRTCEG